MGFCPRAQAGSRFLEHWCFSSLGCAGTWPDGARAMAVVSVCSTKGGVGKTTLVICLADAFARQGGSVAIIDADPNRHVASWRERAGDDCTVDVIAGVTEKEILDRITEAA